MCSCHGAELWLQIVATTVTARLIPHRIFCQYSIDKYMLNVFSIASFLVRNKMPSIGLESEYESSPWMLIKALGYTNSSRCGCICTATVSLFRCQEYCAVVVCRKQLVSLEDPSRAIQQTLARKPYTAVHMISGVVDCLPRGQIDHPR